MVNLLDKAILMVCLLQLDQWPHFKENSKLYSLHDLYNIATGDLMTQLKETHQLYSNHITLACHVSTSLFCYLISLFCYVTYHTQKTLAVKLKPITSSSPKFSLYLVNSHMFQVHVNIHYLK